MTEQLILIVAGAIVLIFVTRIMKKIPSSTQEIKLSPKWREILNQKVPFYSKLSPEDKSVFEQRIIVFLNSVKITPIDCELEELDSLLIASSAIIPVFNFPTWVYPNLKEVLLYPKPFNAEFSHEGEANIQGMVGNGFMNGKMILSKTSLKQGFQAELDKKNVGIHEFVHLIDGVDGKIDGIPKVLMTQQYSLPWLDLVYKKMKEIESNKSDLRLYGATNEQEFLAVVSEYFFEHPTQLKKKHPELYTTLTYFFSEK